ncbi:MAG: MFS transporter [Tunicatimonas sp.]
MPPTPPLLRARLAVAALFFINGTGFATWIPHIPFAQRKFDLDEAALGLTLLAIAAGAILTMPLAGGLIARWGSRRLCGIAGVAFCLALPLLLAAPSYPLFVFALFLLGACGGAMDVAMNAHGVYVEDEYAKPIMSSFHGLFSVGGLVGAGIAAGLLALGWTPVRHTVVMAGVLLLLTGVALRYLLPPEPKTADRETSDSPLFILPRERATIILAALAFAVFMAEGSMADWTAVYLLDLPGTDAALAAVGFAIFSLTMAVGRLTGDAIVRLLGRVSVVRWGSVLAMAGMLLSAFSPSPFWAIGGFALVGLGLSNVVPIIFSAAGYLSPGSPGQGIAAVSTAGYFGFLVGPPIIGFLAEWITLSGAFQVLAVGLLLMALSAKRVQQKNTTAPRPSGVHPENL